MAIFGQYGVSIHVGDSVLGTSLIGARYFQERDWAESANSYTHSISVDIGFDKMSFSFSGSRSDIEDWLEGGLALHVAVYNRDLSIVWEGFVNNMSASLGSLSVTRGSLLDIVNRSKVDYKTIRFDTNPPIGGNATSTDLANDTDSQGKYGIMEGYVSGGEGALSSMEDLRDTFIEENRLPRTSQDISLGSGQSPSITIECAGYYYLLDKYYYESSTYDSDVNLSTKFGDVVDADPNSILSTAAGGISTNTLQVPEWEDGTKKALGIIKDMVALGDTSSNRWIWGVYEDQEVYYDQAPTSVEYTHSLLDNPSTLTDYSTGKQVEPWDIRPGKWVFMSDFMVGRLVDTNLRDDPRALFIESVSFSTPYSATINGGKLYTFSQKLGRLGLGGQ